MWILQLEGEGPIWRILVLPERLGVRCVHGACSCPGMDTHMSCPQDSPSTLGSSLRIAGRPQFPESPTTSRVMASLTLSPEQEMQEGK